MSMFCYQCEQTKNGGCAVVGMCGKDPQTAALQDLMIHGAKGLAMYAHRARAFGGIDEEIDRFAIEILFTTVTNVNFDIERHVALLAHLATLRDRARGLYERGAAAAGVTPEALEGPAAWRPATDLAGLVRQGEAVGIRTRQAIVGEERTGLEELALYGLKGLAAYADHALLLGQSDTAVFAFVHEALDALTRELEVSELLALSLRVGEANLRVMELLDGAHTSRYGHPVPTPVRVTPVEGKAILVSGHDLVDLEALLQQTAGRGINIYTHGEMLPAHGYPGLKKYPHLVGNFGGAWQDQRREFADFPGAILMTTNCIQRPAPSYQSRLFTCGLVAWPGVAHIENRDFEPVIQAALAATGFPVDADEQTVLTGFGHDAVLGVADQVVAAVQSGAIRHFFLIGGCDGAEPGRDYYTRLAESVPKDAVILTLACGKYRFNRMDFGTIGGIPRLLDMGQCNDAFSAIRVAAALADAFGTDVNGLPLSLVLSWFEQKAVAILLSLLHLGVRDIRIGPQLPAFLTPGVVGALHDQFGLRPVTTPAQDLAAMLGT